MKYEQTLCLYSMFVFKALMAGFNQLFYPPRSEMLQNPKLHNIGNNSQPCSGQPPALSPLWHPYKSWIGSGEFDQISFMDLARPPCQGGEEGVQIVYERSLPALAPSLSIPTIASLPNIQYPAFPMYCVPG